MAETPEPQPIDFKVIAEPLNNLLTAVGNKLSREWPMRYSNVIGARELFVSYVRAAQQMLLSSLFLCGDNPPEPKRKPEYCVALAPMNRSLLDSLFTVLFITEDLPSRCEWFYEASWKETRLELERLTAEYGHLPDWQSWLRDLRAFVEWGVTYAKLSPEQAANPKALRSWLNTGAMWRFQCNESLPLPSKRAFMKYLDDFFYIDLSQQAHLTPFGMMKRVGFLIDEIHTLPSTEAPMKKYRYFQIAQTTVFALAIASELEAHFSLGLRQECLFVWGVVSQTIVIGEEMYRKRYRELLST